jgi:aminodeoxyfutalosine deaminase
VTYPKIELHVHIEGAVRPATLLTIAERNGVSLPARSPEDLERMLEFTDFAHFLDMYRLGVTALRTARDFEDITVAYAREAASHGAVYIEAIFSAADPIRNGVAWDEVFDGFCNGAARAEEEIGTIVRFTPDITRDQPYEVGQGVVAHAIKYKDRGIVGIGLGGPEVGYPPEPWAPLFAQAREAGLPAVPHAGETAGVASIRGALDELDAVRLRHGVRAVDDPGLLNELAERRIVCDVCPTSNFRLGVASEDTHPLATMMAAGVMCSISTDDPGLFSTDLRREYEIAEKLGASPASMYEAGLAGALCDEATRQRLRTKVEDAGWGT